MTSSDARGVAEPSTAVMPKTSWSTTTPSAFSPSTSAVRIVVAVIDTPSTSSTAPSHRFARRLRLSAGAESRVSVYGMASTWACLPCDQDPTRCAIRDGVIRPNIQTVRISLYDSAFVGICCHSSEVGLNEGKDLVRGGEAAEVALLGSQDE